MITVKHKHSNKKNGFMILFLWIVNINATTWRIYMRM